jgi:hypothetical protein
MGSADILFVPVKGLSRTIEEAKINDTVITWILSEIKRNHVN